MAMHPGPELTFPEFHHGANNVTGLNSRIFRSSNFAGWINFTPESFSIAS